MALPHLVVPVLRRFAPRRLLRRLRAAHALLQAALDAYHHEVDSLGSKYHRAYNPRCSFCWGHLPQTAPFGATVCEPAHCAWARVRAACEAYERTTK